MLRLTQRFPAVSFGLLFILAVASAVFADKVSPLRNPTFQPNSANAGSLLPWMRGVYESTWLTGSSILAGLLAISLTLVLRQWSEAQIPADSQSQNALGKIAGFWFHARWVAIGIVLCIAFWLLGFMYYTYADPNMSSMTIFLAAALLAIHFTFIFWLWNQLQSFRVSTPWYRGLSKNIAQSFLFLYWAGVAIVVFEGLRRLFLGYLLGLWLVD